jgi:hypothetical protein
VAEADGPTDELGRPIADQERILVILAANDVDFLIAGGFAVVFHGYVRFTADLDIIPSPAAANMALLADALRELDAAAVGSRGERRELDLSDPESLAVGNYFLVTKHGAMDLFNGPRPDLKRYRRLESDSVSVTVADREVKVISKADLIAMKREAGRPKDLADIAALTEVERAGADPGSSGPGDAPRSRPPG